MHGTLNIKYLWLVCLTVTSTSSVWYYLVVSSVLPRYSFDRCSRRNFDQMKNTSQNSSRH